MIHVRSSTDPELRRRLLALLEQVVPARDDVGPALVDYVVRRREVVRAVVLEQPVLGVILSGVKEVHVGGRTVVLPAGAPFVLPAGQRLDVVNDPDAHSGLYRAALVQFPPDLIRRARLAHPAGDVMPGHLPHAFAVRPGPILTDSLVHAVAALRAPGLDRCIVEHRAMEVLLHLRAHPALVPSARAAMVERVRARLRLDAATSVAGICRGLGVAPATLRRHLAEGGTSWRALLEEARMDLAWTVLSGGRASIAEAAALAGYASRSRFATRFRDHFGLTPGQVRRRAGLSGDQLLPASAPLAAPGGVMPMT